MKVNGVEAELSRRIENGDKMEVAEITTLNEFCRWLGMPPERYTFVVGGESKDGSYILLSDDQIRAVSILASPMPEEGKKPPAQIDKSIENTAMADRAIQTAAPGPRMNVRINGSPVELSPKEDGMPYQFVDMLNYVDIDPTKPRGNIILRLNGQNASYLELIREGDRIDILWDSDGAAN